MKDRPQPLHRRNRVGSQYDAQVANMVAHGSITVANKATAYRIKKYAESLGHKCDLVMKPTIKITLQHGS